MSRARRISPGAAARRSFLGDVFCGIAIALVTVTVCAGIGIVGVVALLTLLAIGLWFAIEALAQALKRRGDRDSRFPCRPR